MNDYANLRELRGWIDELTEIRATLAVLADRIDNATDVEVANHLCRRLANVEEYLDFLLQDDDVDHLRHNFGKLSVVYERGPVTDAERELLDTLRAQYEAFFAAPSSIDFIDKADR